jgi:glycosyltransferase involved in cell wall biosynthesis
VTERLSVVIPVFKEQDNIARCLRGVSGALAGVEHEILICYDLDDDPTLDAIARMSDRPESVRLVKNDLGRGAGFAIRAGFAAATGDVVVTTMADLSDPPELLPRMAQTIRQDGAAVVSGSRYMPGGAIRGGPPLKVFLSRVAGLSLRWIAGLGTHDATTNYRAYSRSLLERVSVRSTKGFDIALELTVKAQILGLPISEIPSTWVERDAGTSQFRLFHWMPHYLRWYALAMAEPALVLAIFSILAVFAFVTFPIGTFVTALFCELAFAAIVVARVLRGRTRILDALHALLWLHPWMDELVVRLGLPAVLAVHVVLSTCLLIWTRRYGRARS